MAKIFLFRHGQTTDNKNGIFSGWSDPDLTEEGIEEAKTIGKTLQDQQIDKSYCSDLLRSKHTLELILSFQKQLCPIIIDPRLRERDYGDLTGKNKKEIAREYPREYPLWHRSYETAPLQGESIKDVEGRVLPFVHELLQNLKKDQVAVISAHGNSLRPIRKYFEHLSNDIMCSFEHVAGKIYTYEV